MHKNHLAPSKVRLIGPGTQSEMSQCTQNQENMAHSEKKKSAHETSPEVTQMWDSWARTLTLVSLSCNCITVHREGLPTPIQPAEWAGGETPRVSGLLELVAWSAGTGMGVLEGPE